MRFRMAVLILAIFCVGTAELAPSGMLGDLSRDLSVTVPTAGLLVTVYALTVVVGGPIVTALSPGSAASTCWWRCCWSPSPATSSPAWRPTSVS